MKWNNGSYYDGNWKQGQMFGKGKFFMAEEGMTKDGVWDDDGNV